MPRILPLRMLNACTHIKTRKLKTVFPVMDCPRVHERSVSADLKRAGSGDEIGHTAEMCRVSLLPDSLLLTPNRYIVRMLKKGIVRFMIKESNSACLQACMYLTILDIEASLKSHVTGINRFKLNMLTSAFLSLNFFRHFAAKFIGNVT